MSFKLRDWEIKAFLEAIEEQNQPRDKVKLLTICDAEGATNDALFRSSLIARLTPNGLILVDTDPY